MSALGLLDEELLAKIKNIQMRAKFMVNEAFAGEYKSAFKGRGVEFEEVREYMPGDDIRSIDWNVTARSNRPFIKIYRDERELTVMFVVDVSASSKFGTIKKFKNEVAAEVTALLAYSALKNNDKVGLIIFSDHVEHYIPPKKGRGHVWRLIREILTYKSNSKKTNLKAPLEFINKVLKKKAITFLISDFMEEDYQKELAATSTWHDLVAISVTDPREQELPKIGFIELEDAETGEYLLIDTGNAKLVSEFAQAAKNRSKDIKRYFRRNKIDYMDLKTDETYIDTIVRFFHDREKRF